MEELVCPALLALALTCWLVLGAQILPRALQWSHVHASEVE